MVYFSATFTTRRVLREIARVIGANVVEHDFTCGLPFGELRVDGEGDLLVVGAPVYAGRLPVRAARAFGMLRGAHTPAVAVCVYGNRDYDDALVEEQDIIEANGFKTVAAGAFIGRHCIFPKVAAGRPDADDMRKVADFASRCAGLLGRTVDVTSLRRCMTCVSQCPMEAIPAGSPWTTDGDRCIACGRCVVVCPERSRAFGGDAYREFEAKFVSAFSARREPETFFPALG